VLTPVGLTAFSAAILGLLTARAAQNLGQHGVTKETDVAQWLVRRPVHELTSSVTIPRTAAPVTNIHVLLDLPALVAHAVGVAHIDHIAIRLVSALTGISKRLSKKNGVVVLFTIDGAEDAKRLLVSRDGFLILLEHGERVCKVEQRGCKLRVATAVHQAQVIGTLLVNWNGLGPEMLHLVALSHVRQQNRVAGPILVLDQQRLEMGQQLSARNITVCDDRPNLRLFHLGLLIDNKCVFAPPLVTVHPGQGHKHLPVMFLLLRV
jgi:hypothetical protein